MKKMIYFWVINKVKSQSVKISFQPKKTISKNTISKKDNLKKKQSQNKT